ncbi:hypothetical protein NG895_03960 [Aeoliella sp. ICT_H6.2]|uniref:Uncharacterized protein n=1 Tax=Aeoliella straminimaris TaxID=2954799 RepID=A0A9X2F6A9_9BACT|nr:hypothetical protein [Aeoliella straminimaris]MCO6043052.1 hypothetical protein [Aeoliella straminimaris]
MKSLRKSKVLAICGVLAVALAVTVVSAPSAEAGCHGFGYGYASYHAPVHTHYVAPVKVNYVAPIYSPTYFAPSCYGGGCYAPSFHYGYGW